MWLDSKAVNCPQKWGNFSLMQLCGLMRSAGLMRLCGLMRSAGLTRLCGLMRSAGLMQLCGPTPPSEETIKSRKSRD